jgi:hypothetical protein
MAAAMAAAHDDEPVSEPPRRYGEPGSRKIRLGAQTLQKLDLERNWRHVVTSSCCTGRHRQSENYLEYATINE